MIVAIHQPNFFPWLGYFHKIIRADIFVFLDSVQHQKTGGTWSNRVKLLIGGQPRWVTAPTERNFSGVRNVGDITFDESHEWRQKLIRTLQTNYAKGPAYAEAMQLLEPLISSCERQLAVYNTRAVVAIAGAMGFPKEKFIRSSDLGVAGSGSELLIAITKAVGGDVYLCGGGAQGYQNDEAFRDAGVQVQHQDFQHPVYRQLASEAFASGLSIIDALVNNGITGTKALLCE